MIGIRVGVGKIGINAAPMCTSQDIVSIVGINECLWSKEYISLALQHEAPRLVARAQGATITGITSGTLKEVTVPARKIADQTKIVAELNSVKELIRLAKTYSDSLQTLVKSRFIEMFGDGKWTVEALESVADVQGGLTKNKKREKHGLQLPYLRVANVLQGELDLSEILSIGLTEVERDKTQLQAGDMLFVEGNGSRDQIGRSAIWDGSIDPCVHQNHLIRARLSECVLPVFALAYFSSSAGRDQIVAKAVSTSGLFTLSTGKIKALEIPVPPLALQREFAAFAQQAAKLEFVAQRQLTSLIQYNIQ